MFIMNKRCVSAIVIFLYAACLFDSLIAMKKDSTIPNFKYWKKFEGQYVQGSNLNPEGLLEVYGTSSKEDGKIFNFFNMMTNKLVTEFPLPIDGYGVDSVCCSKDCSFFACGGVNPCWLVDAKNKQTRQLKGCYGGFYLCMAFSEDGNYYVNMPLQIIGGSIKIFDVKTALRTKKFKGNDSTQWNFMSLTSDFKYLAAASCESEIRLWEIESEDCLQLVGHKDCVNSVSFSSNNGYLISGSDDKTVKLWDMATKKCIQTFEGHDADVLTVAWVPHTNEKYFASGSSDSTIKIWNKETGECERTLMINNKSEKSNESYTEIITTMFIQFDSTGEYMALRYAKTGQIEIWKKD